MSCVPSDPYSPTILTNYLTAPDCVIWSAVLASAAVPGILNPVVLMMKKPNGTLAPYSFGHKWKDGRYVSRIATHRCGLTSFSLRTDIPLKALNLHFGVNFSIVSQVNPHINLFFFSSRGAVGRPGMYDLVISLRKIAQLALHFPAISHDSKHRPKESNICLLRKRLQSLTAEGVAGEVVILVAP